MYRVISEMKGNYQQRHQRSGSLSGKGTSRCDQCSDRTSFGKKDQIQDIGSAETVVLLSQQKPDDTIEIDLDLDELDATSAELKATYQ